MVDKASPKFFGYLKERGLKWTPEREKVFEEAFRMEGHFEADDLAYRLRKKGSRVSKATVYRTLPILVEAGLIKEVIHGEKHLHYEHVHEGERHDHLICLKCGKIVEFKKGSLRKIEEEVCKENQFVPQKVLIEIFGYCKKCQ
jgi:Fur family ferric uptake transcriptional regulator